MEVDNLKDFIYPSPLPPGAHGEEITLIFNKSTSQYHILKTFNPQKTPLNIIESEFKKLQNLKNPNIMNIYDTFFEKGRFYVLMETCKEGFLEDFSFKNPHFFNEENVFICFLQLLSLFRFFNENDIIYKNFSLKKVFLCENRLKIGELGSEREINAEEFNEYTAPEVLNGLDCDKTNIWALGVALYRLLFNEFPFEGNTKKKLQKNIEEKKFKFKDKKVKISENMKELLKDLLEKDAEDRVEWSDLYNQYLDNKKKKEIPLLLINIEEKTEENTVENIEENEKNEKNEKNEENEKNTEENKEEFINKKLDFPDKNPTKDSKSLLKFFMKKYLHHKAIIAFHAAVLQQGFSLMQNENDVYIKFLWSKQMLFLCEEFLESLVKKLNFFNENEKNFELFTETILYGEIIEIIKEQRLLTEEFFEVAYGDLNSFAIEDNDIFIRIKGLLTKENVSDFGEIFKQIMMGYLLDGMAMIMRNLKENEKEMARKYAIFYVKISDCLNYKEMFLFDDNQEEGFDFERYEKELEIMGIEDIVKRLEIGIYAGLDDRRNLKGNC